MRTFFLVLFLFLLTPNIYTQTTFEIGTFIAAQRTWLLNSPFLTTKGLATYHKSYGLYGEVIMPYKLGVGFGINRSSEGQKYTFTTVEGERFFREIILEYVQYPVYILYQYPIKDYFSLVFKTGFQYGKKIRENIFDEAGIPTVVFFGREKLDLMYGTEAVFLLNGHFKLFTGWHFSHTIAGINDDSRSLVLSARLGGKYIF